MPISNVDICQCADCQQVEGPPAKKLHQQINLLMSRLDEQQRRWYVAVEANRVGHGGVRLLSQITGVDEKTIQRGQQELEQDLSNRPAGAAQVRLSGGGRQRVEKKTRL